MDAEATQSIDRRLARIEGQVRGLRRMVSEGAYCVDILTQLTAVKSAMEQVAAAIATQHIRHCVAGNDGHEHAKQMSQSALWEELEEVLGRLVR